MNNLFETIQQTAAFLKERIKSAPVAGIILGSGLSECLDSVQVEAEISYEDIPNFPTSTVEGHAGKLIFGQMGGKPIIMMAGRFHYYEGYSMQEITFPVRVIKALGAEVLIVSNAAGGMNPVFKIGDLMMLSDHINLFPEHPLRGANDERLGTRFPDMSQPYDKELMAIASAVAEENGIDVRSGVYAGLSGPTFETPAEYKWLRTISADAVGMSTVPEVIVAKHGGMRVFAVSVITDLGVEGHVETITHEEVLEAAHNAAPKLAAIIGGLIERI